MHDDITDIPGIRVGHYTNLDAATGCTVILCDNPAIGGVEVRGGAPATRETDLLHSHNLVEEVNAILLTGGSAYGLDAASGVMRYLEQHRFGYDTGIARVPIVPAAAIFDLGFGSANIRPDAEEGYEACVQATTRPVIQGNVGAGTGATVGKMAGPAFMMKGGLGSACMQMSDGTLVGTLVVVNALGDIIDPDTRQIVAGARNPTGEGFLAAGLSANTTIAVVATTASLSKHQVNKIVQMAHNGIAQVIHPAHTMFDGDAIFGLAMGPKSQLVTNSTLAATQVSAIGAAAATTLARAILKAIRNATELHGVPAASQ